MAKVILSNGEVMTDPAQLFERLATHPAKLVRRVKAVPMDRTYTITEQGRRLVEELKAKEEVKQA